MADGFDFHNDVFVLAVIRRRVLLLARAPVFNESEVDDLVQEIHLRLMRSIQSYDPAIGHPYPFLCTAIQRIASKIFRERSTVIAECAFVCNCFVAHRDILRAIRWDEDLKVDEHWDFFWRAKIAGVRVGVAMDHVFPHIHVDPPAYKRHRPVFLRAALRKHGLRKVLWK